MATLEQLKAKYQGAIDLGQRRGVSWKNIHVENGKLLLRGAAPSDAVKNEVWSAIKAVDASYADLTVDLSVDPSLPAPGGGAPGKAGRVHEVVAGDTLSKLAKRFYGDAQKYGKIFDANRDKLKDPNLIQPGQQLNIPE